MYEYTGVIDRVIDGDTVIISVDLGFNIFTKERFRLALIDAPEIRGKEKEEGFKSKEFLEQTLNQYDNEVYIKSLGKDKYGRYLVQLYLKEENGHLLDINGHMVNMGYTKTYEK